MAPATSGRNCQLQAGDTESYPVKTLTTLFNGTAIALDAAGYAVSLTDSSAVIFVGISMEDVDNHAGLDGAVRVNVYRRGTHAMVAAGLAITDGGCDLYWADNQTVQKVATNQYAGKLSRFTTATQALLDIEGAVRDNPDVATYNGLVLALASVAVPVLAATTITAGDLVATTVGGFAVRATAATAVRFCGKANATADNAGGGDGAITVSVLQLGKTTLAGAALAFTQADLGRPVFVGATQTQVTLENRDGGLLVGRIARYISAISVEVDLTPGVAGHFWDIVSLPVQAAKNINVLGAMIVLDNTLGGAMLANDADGESFMGIGLTTPNNGGGALGDLRVWVARSGVFNLTGAGLAVTDAGKEVWVGADSVTITTTPGDKLVGILERYIDATTACVRIRPLALRGERADRRFTIPFVCIGEPTEVLKTLRADMEFGRKYIVLSGFADCITAPGGAVVCTITLTDATTTFVVTITGAAVHGENKTAGTVPMKANFDTDITAIDDGAGGVTANIQGHFVIEYC